MALFDEQPELNEFKHTSSAADHQSLAVAARQPPKAQPGPFSAMSRSLVRARSSAPPTTEATRW